MRRMTQNRARNQTPKKAGDGSTRPPPGTLLTPSFAPEAAAAPPRGVLGPFPKRVARNGKFCIVFRDAWDLQNGTLASARAQFSLFQPSSILDPNGCKMQPKWSEDMEKQYKQLIFDAMNALAQKVSKKSQGASSKSTQERPRAGFGCP